jgi:hypothetical protein
MMTDPEISDSYLLFLFERTLPPLDSQSDWIEADWLRQMAKFIAGGGAMPDRGPKLPDKFNKAIGALSNGRAGLLRAALTDRARNAHYRALANGTADEIIDGLGIRDVKGPHWDALRAQIHRAAAIKKDSPERSSAWGAFDLGLRAAESAMDDPQRADSISQNDRLYWRTKRRLLDLYMRYETAPVRWDLTPPTTETTP